MMNNDEKILVVGRRDLFPSNDFQGFLPHSSTTDFEHRIISKSFFFSRAKAEKDHSLKQPIGYCVIVNPNSGKIFLYRRASNPAEYHEKRLHGRYSVGIGGHIDESDSKGIGNLIKLSTIRELKEEIGEEIALSSDTMRVVGYINDDSNDVGRVHFGLVYLVLTSLNAISPASGEIEECSFKSLSELEEFAKAQESGSYEIETWSCHVIRNLTSITKGIIRN